MKSFLLGVLAISSLLFGAEIEFDGGYIKTNDGKNVEIKARKAFTTQISRGGMSIMQLMQSPKTYYIIDKANIIDIAKKDFKGLSIKGRYKFESFSLHPLQEKILQKNEGLFENHGPASNGKPFYIPGDKLEINRKSIGTDAYYFEPKAKLETGEYVAWIGGNFWVFKIK